MPTISDSLDYKRQLGYFSYCLRQLPRQYDKLDVNRLTLVHFAVQSLDLIGDVWSDGSELAKQLSLDKQAIIDWIYALQVISCPSESVADFSEDLVGFKGGTFLGGSFGVNSGYPDESIAKELLDTMPWYYNHGHIAMTYTALCTLRTLGDDWSRLDKKGIIRALKHLQLEDGSFQCISVGSENDMRFLYCASCISYMLQDWSGMDTEKACQYIRDCKSFDGALALIPGQEGHGGSTFTGIASLVLMGKLDEVLDEEWKRELIYWCVARQKGGMQGRPNKDEDTCYSYWIGGTLKLLQADHLLDHEQLCEFVFECQSQLGGFSKCRRAYPDIMHSFYSLAYLSLAQDQEKGPCTEEEGKTKPNLKFGSLNCTLGVSAATAASFEPPMP